MRVLSMMVLAVVAGSAQAGDEYLQYREYGANDYAAQLVYRMDFAADRVGAQSLALRLDNEAAAARGAPAVFHAGFGAQGLDTLKLNGVELRGAMLSAQQNTGGGVFAGLEAGQLVFIGFATLVGGWVVAESADDDDETPTAPGTGAN